LENDLSVAGWPRLAAAVDTKTRTPFFDAVRPTLSALAAPSASSNAGATDTRQQLNALAKARGLSVRFSAPIETTSARAYEATIDATGAVPTRANAHDFFNAVQWLAFPRLKAAINAAHMRHLATESGTRVVPRDVLTMLDESGVLVASRDESLLALLRTFQWHALFVTRRAEVIANMRFALIGHGLLEKALDPFVGLTGKAVLLQINDDQSLDDAAARWVADDANLASTRHLAPLPLLGVPGWDARNEDARFYDNADYFRAGRMRDGSLRKQ
jgi:hypothetical protein